jgi:hypothetical protein
MATRITDGGIDNAEVTAESSFDAPETAGAKCGNFLHDLPLVMETQMNIHPVGCARGMLGFGDVL